MHSKQKSLKTLCLFLAAALLFACLPPLSAPAKAAGAGVAEAVASDVRTYAGVNLRLRNATSASGNSAVYVVDRSVYPELSCLGEVYTAEMYMNGVLASSSIASTGRDVSNHHLAEGLQISGSLGENTAHYVTPTGMLLGAAPAPGAQETFTVTASLTVVWTGGGLYATDACAASVQVTVIGKDSAALRNAVQGASALRESCWTAESWGTFSAALQNASAVLANNAALQPELDSALADLNAARGALVHSGPITDCVCCAAGSAPASPAPAEFRNLVYGADPVRQSLNLWLPQGVSGDTPLILYIHGGGWIAGDKEAHDAQCVQDCLKYGIPVATMNYRYTLLGAVSIYEILDDVSAALSKIKSVAAGSGLNVVKFMPVGYSAGAHIALMYAYTRQASAPVRPVCVFSNSGPTTLWDEYLVPFYPEDQMILVLGALCGQPFTKETAEQAAPAMMAASPSGNVTAETVPTVICHGQKDTVIPYADAQILDNQLTTYGVTHTFLTFPNSGHGLEADPDMAAQAAEVYDSYVQTYLLDVRPAAAHDYAAVTVARTCTADGYTLYTCADCGAYYVGDVVPAAHTPREAVRENEVAATCKDPGGYDEVVYCAVCGEELSRTARTVEKTDAHTPGPEQRVRIAAATCTENGSESIRVYCAVCGAVLSESVKVLPKTGHTDSDGDGFCDVCRAGLGGDAHAGACGHICHSENPILRVLWKILNFFNKLFRINKTCACGEAHW